MKTWLRFIALAVVVSIAAAASQAGASSAPVPVAGPEHVRGVEQTLLTYPEWFLVFSPHEYAEYIASHPPSQFPFYGHIGQFWQGYKTVFDETRRRSLDLNPGYHLMIMVIGASTTVEYALKSAYEMSIGRLTEATATQPVPEERYAAAVARDYEQFIRVWPWYEFDFESKLHGLWRDTTFVGPNMIRKWERKFALTSEYLIKMGYAKLIKLGTKSIYENPLLVTAVVTDHAPQARIDLPDLKIVQALPDGQALVTIPRYEAFMRYAQVLADQGVEFKEIAGNRSFILVSVLVPSAWQPAAPAAPLLTQPILTRTGVQRVVMTLPVAHLAQALRQWKTENVQLEHVFDY